jgi:hypothetical protein
MRLHGALLPLSRIRTGPLRTARARARLSLASRTPRPRAPGPPAARAVGDRRGTAVRPRGPCAAATQDKCADEEATVLKSVLKKSYQGCEKGHRRAGSQWNRSRHELRDFCSLEGPPRFNSQCFRTTRRILMNLTDAERLDRGNAFYPLCADANVCQIRQSLIEASFQPVKWRMRGRVLRNGHPR